MDQKAIIKHLRRNIAKYELQVDELTNKLAFQSRILNSLRELLLIKTEWDGTFGKNETLTDLVKELIEDANIKPRSIDKLYNSGHPDQTDLQ